MNIVLRQDDGTEIDITDKVHHVYALLTASMDYGSNFLTIEDVSEITWLALACGFHTIEEADAQLRAYVLANTVVCPTCRVGLYKPEQVETHGYDRVMRFFTYEGPLGLTGRTLTAHEHLLVLHCEPGEPASLGVYNP